MRQHPRISAPSARAFSPLRLESLEERDVPAVVGTLDPSFGTGGIVSAPATTAANNQANAITVDSLGRTVIVGVTTGPGGGYEFLVQRFNPDGTPDTTFGTNGQTTISFGTGSDIAIGVVVQPNGDIVVVGGAAGTIGQMMIARLTATGALDTTFNGTGELLIPPPTGDTDVSGDGVTLDANGNLVIAGTANTNAGTDFAVIRVTPTGAIDPTFNGGAFKTLNALPVTEDEANNDQSNAVSIDHNGDIVVTGSATFGQAQKLAAFRLLPDGTLDTTFGGGIVTVNVGTESIDSAAGAAVDSSDNVYIAGASNSQGQLRPAYSLAVVKLTSAGAVDTTFGTNGVFTADPGGQQFSGGSGIAVQPGGQIVVGGETMISTKVIDFLVLRLLSNGALDPSFNPTGTTPGEDLFVPVAGDNNDFSGLALTPDGQIMIGGTSRELHGQSIGTELARLIGQNDSSTILAVGGGPNGSAQVYTPNLSTGQLSATAEATIAAFGTLSVDVRVATADVNGDGIPDIILVTGPGTPIRVAVVSGADDSTVLVQPFDPFGGNFTGGGFVSAGDFNGSGAADIVVSPDEGGGPRIVIYSLPSNGQVQLQANFFGINDTNFRGGVRTAVGDVNGDGTPDLVVAAGYGGGPRVAIYDGKTVLSGTPTELVNDFFAFPGADAGSLCNGVYVAVGDVNGDGFDDLIFGAGSGGAPRVFILSGQQVVSEGVAAAQASPIANFFVNGDSTDRGGVRVATLNATGSDSADLVVGSGSGEAGQAIIYSGPIPAGNTREPTTLQTLSVNNGAVLTDGAYVG